MDALAGHCIVEIGSRRFDSWINSSVITEASIELTTDKSGEGVIGLYDPRFELIDSFTSSTGLSQLQARFWFGWGADLGNSFFVGTLARTEWNEGVSRIRFHDFSSKMKSQKKSRYHNKKTDLQILKKLAEENGLKFVGPTKVGDSDVYDSLIQRGKTDWEFALKIAERAGLKLYVRGDTLFAKEAAMTGSSISTMTYGKDFTLLRGFSLSYKLPENKKGKPRKVEVRGRGRGGKQISGQNITGERGVTELIINEDLPKHSVSAAKRRASGKTNRRREYAFEHELQTLPSFSTRLDLNDTITLGGFGNFYSGNYLVTKIGYRFSPGKLICEFSVGRDIK